MDITRLLSPVDSPPISDPHPPPTGDGGAGQPPVMTIAISRRTRRKWSSAETDDLIRGCHTHGVGSWKRILEDDELRFDNRSSVDLKDRFRTCFPEEYRNKNAHEALASLPPPPVHDSGATPLAPPPQLGAAQPSEGGDNGEGAALVDGVEGSNSSGGFARVKRRERREFTPDEDAHLLAGFNKYGAAWTRIQKDPELQLRHRRGMDLRDRFRNAFPDIYESAGFKAHRRFKPPRSSSHVSLGASTNIGAGGYVGEDRQASCVKGGYGVDPEEAKKFENPTLPTLAHSPFQVGAYISPGWVTEGQPIASSSQPLVPSSSTLDAAFLGESFGTIADELVSFQADRKVTQSPGQSLSHSMVHWREMANNPIFDLGPFMPLGPPNGLEVGAERLQGFPTNSALGAVAPVNPHNSLVVENGVMKGNSKREVVEEKHNDPKKHHIDELVDR